MYYHHGKIYCYLWWKIAACYSKIWSSFRKCLPGWKILVISPCYGEIHKWFKTRFIVNIRVTIITKTIFKFFLSESELIFIFSLSIASGVLSPLKCKINKRHEQLFYGDTMNNIDADGGCIGFVTGTCVVSSRIRLNPQK